MPEKLRTDTHRTLTNVTTVVRRGFDRPAAEVWALLPDALLGADEMPTFVVPGTAVDDIGEVRCLVRRRGDGALVGSLHELLAIVPGHTRVTREVRQLPLVTTTTVEPTSDTSCEVAVWLTFPSIRKEAEEMRARMAIVPRVQLDELTDRLAGLPPVATRRTQHDESDLRSAEVHVRDTLPATPADVWAVVRPAENARLDQADPDAVTFTVPGTPAGEVGEKICLVARWRPPIREAAILEVIAQESGTSFAVRSLSAPHLLAQAVVLKAVPGGTEMTVTVHLHEHEPVIEREAATRRAAALAYLDRVREAVALSRGTAGA